MAAGGMKTSRRTTTLKGHLSVTFSTEKDFAFQSGCVIFSALRLNFLHFINFYNRMFPQGSYVDLLQPLRIGCSRGFRNSGSQFTPCFYLGRGQNVLFFEGSAWSFTSSLERARGQEAAQFSTPIPSRRLLFANRLGTARGPLSRPFARQQVFGDPSAER
jgi:hypothetical protein